MGAHGSVDGATGPSGETGVASPLPGRRAGPVRRRAAPAVERGDGMVSEVGEPAVLPDVERGDGMVSDVGEPTVLPARDPVRRLPADPLGGVPARAHPDASTTTSVLLPRGAADARGASDVRRVAHAAPVPAPDEHGGLAEPGAPLSSRDDLAASGGECAATPCGRATPEYEPIASAVEPGGPSESGEGDACLVSEADDLSDGAAAFSTRELS